MYLWNNGSDVVLMGFLVVEVNFGDDVYMSFCNVSQLLGEIISDIYCKISFVGWCIVCVGQLGVYYMWDIYFCNFFKK